MIVDIVIPTLDRRRKLEQCLESIGKQKLWSGCYCNIWVYFSREQDAKVCPDVAGNRAVFKVMIPDYSAPVLWNRHLKGMSADVLCYLSDDVILEQDCLAIAIACMRRNYSDTDGVVGFNQYTIKSPSKSKAAFGLLGKKFADRFPDRQAFCPDYKRFYIDQELQEFAEWIGKFTYCEEAKVNHQHPSIFKSMADKTHALVRQHLPEDKEMFMKRREKGYLWGKDYSIAER